MMKSTPERILLIAVASLTATTVLAVPGRPRYWAPIAVDPASGGPQQSVSIVLSGLGGRQPRLAVPDFTLAGNDAELKGAADTVADVLWQDLEFEEEFYLIPRLETRAIPPATSGEALPIVRWKEIGADFVLLASVRRAGDDMPVDVRVFSITGDSPRKQVFGDAGRSFGCSMSHLRTCAHTIADRLHKELRNLDGSAMTRLAFVSDRGSEHIPGGIDRGGKEIYVSDYDGMNPAPVTANHKLNISPTWSADGQLLAYVSYVSGQMDIYVKSVYEAKQAWRPAGGTSAIANNFPAFSPDGKQIAFISNRDGTYQVYVVDTYGTAPPQRLTSNRAWEGVPTWSPQGTQIAFTSDRASPNTPRLFVMNPDGTGQEALSCGARCERPSWSPLGDQIAFTCGKDTPYNICTLNLRANTNQVQQLLPVDGFSNEQPVFSPNGKHIAFKTTRWGKDQIAIIDLKGKIQRRVTDIGNNTFPAWSRPKR
jgi:TolB protein